jgi:hypothetical protein
VAASLFALALAGCDALRGVGELEQAIAREQAAITAYSAAVPEADRLAAVFAEALGRAREHAARRVYREDLAAHAMPAGKAWVEALRAMPGQDSAELAGLHTPLVSAADGLVAALAAVVATGDDAGPEAFAVREADVEARLLALREAEGRSEVDADREVDAAIDRLVHHAGWCDKFEQIYGGTNPVASHHFNVSTVEALGVVTILGSKRSGLLGLVSTVAPVIALGNAAIVVVEGAPGFTAVELAEVLATSDLPGGVVNILTGSVDELLPHVASHAEGDGVFGVGLSDEQRRLVGQKAADTVKRTFFIDDADLDGWAAEAAEGPWWIAPFTEVKTAWHPIGL